MAFAWVILSNANKGFLQRVWHTSASFMTGKSPSTLRPHLMPGFLLISCSWSSPAGGISSQQLAQRSQACQKLLMCFMEDVIADMAGFIPLSAIGKRILSEFACEPFGHFKSSIVGLLGAFSYELSILQVPTLNCPYSLPAIGRQNSTYQGIFQLLDFSELSSTAWICDADYCPH